MKKLKIPKIVSDFEIKERIILRDFLALERTTLANERTLFSYIRTSLYLVLGGIALIQLENLKELRWLGFVAFLLSSFLIVFGLLRYFKLRNKLRKFYAQRELQDTEVKSEN